MEEGSRDIWIFFNGNRMISNLDHILMYEISDSGRFKQQGHIKDKVTAKN